MRQEKSVDTLTEDTRTREELLAEIKQLEDQIKTLRHYITDQVKRKYNDTTNTGRKDSNVYEAV